MRMEQLEPMYFELKGNGDFLRVTIQKAIDKYWLDSKVQIKVGGFVGSYDCNLTSQDLISFTKEFTALYNRLDGYATFDTPERQIEIKIKGDGIGHFEANCVAIDQVGIGNQLKFNINFDQTFIPDIVKQLENIIKSVPMY